MTQRNREIIERTARQRRRRGRGGLKRRRRRRRRKGRMMKKRYTLPGALQADASTCTCMHTYTFVRAVSVSPGAKARNHAAWKKEEEEEEGPLRPSGPHRCTEDGLRGTRGGVPHHEPRRGATVVPLRARKREEIAASFVHPPHPLSPVSSRRRAEGTVEEEEEEVGFTVPRGRSARQYAVRGPCGDFTTDRLPLLSSPPLILLSFLFLAVYPLSAP